VYLPEEEGISLYLGKNPDDIVEGFDVIVISPGVPCDLPFLNKAREAGIPVWGEIELAFVNCPCPVVAITGTNGKTTVTTLVGEMLHRHNRRTVVVGNIASRKSAASNWKPSTNSRRASAPC
jgi:UDP-N-acetylmuramoylalanine--D-glutamate ligase